MQNRGAGSPLLLLGDHAGRAIPRALDDLGLPPAERERHIAWDIGVAGAGLALARRLDAPFVSQRYSRLVMDCNRDPARADAIPAISDGTVIPANQNLSHAAREARREAVHAPYHAAIAGLLDARSGTGATSALVSVHSFTPRMAGFVRPWMYGVLHRRDSAFSRALLAGLRSAFGPAAVGDNEPYAMDEVDYTIPTHAGGRGLQYVELEINQRLIGDPAGEAAQAELLAPILAAAYAAARRAGPG